MSHFPPSCRIVVVSSSCDTSKSLSHRIKSYAGDHDNDTSTPTGSPQQHRHFIPWNIANKYYTAQVHFHPVDISGLDILDWDEVPAVVFTWREGESFKEHLKKIATLSSSYSPEVSLAISFDATEEDLESLCFEYGFEYIHFVEDTDSGDSGIHRAVDALSTIMWPTMQRVISGKSTGYPRSPLPFAFDSFTSNFESEIILNDLIKDSERSVPPSAGAKTRIQLEMEAFERWINDVVPSPLSSRRAQALEPEDDAWNVGSPTPGTSAKTSRQFTDSISPGFDDDFTDFISAPSIDAQRDGRRIEGSTPTRDSTATSDIASDEDLPNHDDILKTSTRIFGAPRGGHSESRPPLSPASRSPAEDEGYMDLGEEAYDSLTELDRDEHSGFDLSRIFSSLQLMKEEISGMEDESERRKAAARVALGLVYGLGTRSDDNDSDNT